MRIGIAILGFVVAQACGGTAVTVTSAIEGSYDLVFSEVNVDPISPSLGPPGKPPLEGAHARLDIRVVPNGYDAMITPEWGSPQRFYVTSSSNQVVLDKGEAHFNASTSSYGSVDDTIDRVVLARAGKGLTGMVSASGTENVFQGDVGGQSKFTASAVLAKDATAPRVRDASPASAGGKHLPWDAIAIASSEPLDEPSMQKAVAYQSVKWQPSSNEWPGVMGILGYATSFDDASGSVEVAGGLLDPSSNASAALSVMRPMLELAPKSTSITQFDKGVWGTTSIQKAPICETDGCLEIGPLQSTCNPPSAGFAARIDTTGRSKISIRWRARSTGMQPRSISVTIATPGSKPTVVENQATLAPAMTMTGSAAYPFESPWETSDFLSVPQGDVGIAIRAASEGGCGGWAPKPEPTVFDIQSIISAQ